MRVGWVWTSTAAAPAGQSPRATRYRMGYAVHSVIRALLAMVGL
jgi:hypothetical protein